MARYTKLSVIPTSKHPFNMDRYEHLIAELKEAAGGFAELGYAGHPYGRELADLANEASRAVGVLWGAMRAVEESEKEPHKGLRPLIVDTALRFSAPP
ncbi:hypothetical protein ASC80_22620 [Afipia sp. Root123D2]|uniref:hypothetical protein n=1 Tax=Afipia sp. Root123D2 TaxID=1736436 RepID=UPI0006FE1C71|nr:hypothetical protein [Afipia sp. Root123D2]KQW17374.1 hypothetical protein ASC80_22620 [Afipia sp. Root123D2]